MSVPDKATLEVVRRRLISERPTYQRLADTVASLIGARLRSAGIYATVSGRAKEIDSALKKLILKRYPDPYDGLTDKAGVRVVADLASDLATISSIIEQVFDIVDRTDKTGSLKADQVGYRGLHFDVCIDESVTGPLSDNDHALRGLQCEIQVQTRAENLWNDASHKLLYKPGIDLPAAFERRVYRLAALMELFDQELETARAEAAALPGNRVFATLDNLERHFYQLTGHPSNRALSVEILTFLLDDVATQDDTALKAQIDRFVDEQRPRLSRLYERHFNSNQVSPLLFQPETILILNELEERRYHLRDRWEAQFPLSLLEDLAALWGITLPSG